MRTKLSGIYAIRCLGDMKIYIGSSSNIEKRLRDHRSFLRTDKHQNKHLQSAYNKYGKDMFIYFIVELCDITNILQKENEWMVKWRTRDREYGFNKIDAEEGCRGRKWSEEHKKYMSETMSGRIRSEEYCENISKAKMGSKNPMYGKKWSDNKKQTMKERMTGNKNRLGHKSTEDTKRKCSESMKKYWQHKREVNND